ncbi:MAG: Hsp20/alpha crystallin family protein [Verrucomicrobiota bacterium]
MSALTHWGEARRDWFKELGEFPHRFVSFFSRPWVRQQGNEENPISFAAWMPRVEVSDDEKEYLIKAKLPGVRKNDVKVTVEDGMLQISGERDYEKEEKGRKYHYVERAHGSFVRRFALPEDADAAHISAEFKDGVLNVHVAKDEKSKAVEVKVV